MGFFPEAKSATQDTLRARKLADLLISHRRASKRPALKVWALEFARIRTVANVQDSRIQQVLDWYCEHLKDKHCPVVSSARTFRSKFPAIEAAMRIQKRTKVDRTTVITPEAREVSEANELRWPNQEKKDELPFIQVSLDNYQQFLVSLYKASQEADNPEIRELAGYAWRYVQAEPAVLVNDWLLLAHRIAWEWAKWQGKLLSWVWHPEHRHYVKWLQEVLLEWDNEEDACQKLLDYLHSQLQHFPKT